jgi:hypothetical protein
MRRTILHVRARFFATIFVAGSFGRPEKEGCPLYFQDSTHKVAARVRNP